jgi:hypothetical protein
MTDQSLNIGVVNLEHAIQTQSMYTLEALMALIHLMLKLETRRKANKKVCPLNLSLAPKKIKDHGHSPL